MHVRHTGHDLEVPQQPGRTPRIKPAANAVQLDALKKGAALPILRTSSSSGARRVLRAFQKVLVDTALNVVTMRISFSTAVLFNSARNGEG